MSMKLCINRTKELAQQKFPRYCVYWRVSGDNGDVVGYETKYADAVALAKATIAREHIKLSRLAIGGVSNGELVDLLVWRAMS